MNRYLVSVFFCVTKMGSEVTALTLGEAFKHVKAWGKENRLYSVAHSLNHSLKERQLVTYGNGNSLSSPPCSTMDDRGSKVLRAYVSLKLWLCQDSALNELTHSTLLTLPKSLPSYFRVFIGICMSVCLCLCRSRQTDRQMYLYTYACRSMGQSQLSFPGHQLPCFIETKPRIHR